MTSVATSTAPTSSNVYHSVGRNSAGAYVVRLVNYNSSPSSATLSVSGASLTAQGSSKWQLNPGGVTNLQAANTVENPNAVTSSEGALSASEIDGNGALDVTLPAYSFTVFTVRAA